MDLGSLEIRYYENDSLLSETFSNDKSIPFWIMQQHSDSVIFIDGIIGMFDASGFRLRIFKETFDVSFFSNADFGIYKKHKSDTTLTAGISVSCKEKSLTLSSYPDFENGDVIIGIIEFKTYDYWQVERGVEKKIRIEGKAFFTTTLTDKKKR